MSDNIVRVPKVPRPAKYRDACWAQQIDPEKPSMLAYCTFARGHKGPHQWWPREGKPTMEKKQVARTKPAQAKPTQANGSHKLTKAGPGRPKGVPNKVSLAAKALCQGLVSDPVYRRIFISAFKRRDIEPQLEILVWHYAFGKPKVNVELEAGNTLADILDRMAEQAGL